MSGPAVAAPDTVALPVPGMGRPVQRSGRPVFKGIAAGKITFGEQMGGQAASACSAITVRAQAGATGTYGPATGPAAGAKSCAYKLSVPQGVPVTISVKFEDLVSKPKGGWTNPVVVKPGVTYDFLMDGKP